MFQIEGQFISFAETAKGKHRLVMRVRGEVVRWKVSDSVRKPWKKVLVPGQPVIAVGRERFDPETEELKRKVTWLKPADAKAAGQLTAGRPACISICTKSNCWKSGGKAVW